MDIITQGFAFDYGVQGLLREAKDGEPAHEGRIAVLVLQPPEGRPIELLCRPADDTGAALVAEAGAAVCRALGHAIVGRMTADAARDASPGDGRPITL